VEVGVAVGGETGMEGGHGEQDGGLVPGIEGGERGDGEEAGLSDGDFEEDDLVLEEDGEDELDSRLKPDHRFFAVRALLEGGKTARKLNRRLKVQAGKDDGFLVKGDERFFRNFNDSSIERRVNMSASFQYNGTCHTCLNGLHDAWQGRDGQPVVMVAGDHHFPANIPAREDGECIRILRVEYGSLAEITGELVRLSPRGGGCPWHGYHARIRCNAGRGKCSSLCGRVEKVQEHHQKRARGCDCHPSFASVTSGD